MSHHVGKVFTDMDNSTLARRLRRIREASGLSQSEMATAIGLNHGSAVAKIEAGDRRVSATEFTAWAKACGTTTDAIASGEPFMVSLTEETA